MRGAWVAFVEVGVWLLFVAARASGRRPLRDVATYVTKKITGGSGYRGVTR